MTPARTNATTVIALNKGKDPNQENSYDFWHAIVNSPNSTAS